MTEADDLIMAHRQVEEARQKKHGARETREACAAIQHEIWSHWMRYLFSQCKKADDGWTIPSEKVSRWVRQMNTPYSELSEREKESDRDQARKVMETLNEQQRRKRD